MLSTCQCKRNPCQKKEFSKTLILNYYYLVNIVLECTHATRVQPSSCIACMMHFKSKISKSISRYKLSRRFYDLVTILLGYKARCCALRCALNHQSTVMYKSDTTAKRCGWYGACVIAKRAENPTLLSTDSKYSIRRCTLWRWPLYCTIVET